jgi:hypothetical protein
LEQTGRLLAFPHRDGFSVGKGFRVELSGNGVLAPFQVCSPAQRKQKDILRDKFQGTLNPRSQINSKPQNFNKQPGVAYSVHWNLGFICNLVLGYLLWLPGHPLLIPGDPLVNPVDLRLNALQPVFDAPEDKQQEYYRNDVKVERESRSHREPPFIKL